MIGGMIRHALIATPAIAGEPRRARFDGVER
jgi:hypothetical protein